MLHIRRVVVRLHVCSTISTQELSTSLIFPIKHTKEQWGGPPTHVYTSGVGPTLEFTVGTRLNSCVLIGGELSLTPRIKSKYQWNPLINIAPHAKFYIPTSKEHVSPYVNLSIGAGSLACVEWGLYTNIGLGVEIKRFNVLAGYRGYAGKFVSLYESDGASLSSAIYLQLGVRLGK